MGIREKIYLEAHINNEYIYLKSNAPQLYYVRENFPRKPKEGSYICKDFLPGSGSFPCVLLEICEY